MKQKIRNWIQSRNMATEADVHRVDALGAELCGLFVLAELIRLREKLEEAHSRGALLSGAEVIVHLAPIIALARGDAQNKLRDSLHDDTIEVPGIVAFRRSTS